MIKHAERLRIRLRLAYYKVLTDQTTLPLKRLPSPETSSEPSCSSASFGLFNRTYPKLGQFTQSTSAGLTKPHIPSMENTSTPVTSNITLGYSDRNPPSSSASTVSMNSTASAESHSLLMTPVKQQRCFDSDGTYTAESSVDALSDTKCNLHGRSLLSTPTSMGAARSLLQLGSTC